MWYNLQTGALVEELNRVSEENKKLTEMLTVMCENYNVLRSQLMDYMNKHPEMEISSPKKRKLESNNNNNKNGTMGNSESSSTDEESCKKPREETIKPKISRVHYRTDASDTGLVSPKTIHILHKILINFPQILDQNVVTARNAFFFFLVVCSCD